jgi:DNA-binding transcriptional MerR regulator
VGEKHKTYTIGRLGALCGLSRSTLLYYDSIGLLPPSGRNASGYRLYSEADRARLEKINLFRSIGIALGRMPELLELQAEGGPAGALLRRVFEINESIAGLKAQQRGILDLLEADGSLKVGKAALLALRGLGQSAGITEGNYGQLHLAFEANAPEEHRRLLRLLGFSARDIEEFLKKIAIGV